mmetsp:Transcript_51545/g.95357  ORF Transcript_51545/g.95357 Transcript_51545/m.95357 type:complete len:212 (-) Transcript_51545:410-1045(-)
MRKFNTKSRQNSSFSRSPRCSASSMKRPKKLLLASRSAHATPVLDFAAASRLKPACNSRTTVRLYESRRLRCSFVSFSKPTPMKRTSLHMGVKNRRKTIRCAASKERKNGDDGSSNAPRHLPKPTSPMVSNVKRFMRSNMSSGVVGSDDSKIRSKNFALRCTTNQMCSLNNVCVNILLATFRCRCQSSPSALKIPWPMRSAMRPRMAGPLG